MSRMSRLCYRPQAALVALLLVAACDSEPSAASPPAEAAPLMKRSVVEPDARQTAAPRAPAPAPKPTTEDPAPSYDRKLWPHWVDADGDCQDARTEVLIAESYAPVSFEDERNCEVAGGRWQCPYTGELIAEVHLLDVDHLVPLANAHRSGAGRWTAEQRRRYANDLDHPEQLVAVDYRANRGKGDKGPEAWLPPLDDARCPYVRDWAAIKRRWSLSMTEAEAAAVADALALCEAGQVPALPQAEAAPATKAKPKSDAAELTPKSTAPGERECCRTCRKGKACGDSCIAKTSTCTKPPGCACPG